MKMCSKTLSIVLITVGLMLALSSIYLFNNKQIISPVSKPEIVIKSIDTMKYSRDVAREKANDTSFDAVIKKQVADIAQTGATHVALGTPYDKEFVPFLKRWVSAARENNLKVWFRGNLSGWEEWFEYAAIDSSTHLKLIEEFIKANPGLFDDGDIFSSCSECENGGQGDPRHTGDTQGFRDFLISEYDVSMKAFREINKRVSVGYFSMNYDVANLIMDPVTTMKLGGIVSIDHYVASPLKLVSDAKSLAKKSGGKIVFGEIGAPIPDLNGKMTEDEQANWINQALGGIFNSLDVVGLNYWVSTGGSTQIWNDDGSPRKAVEVIKKYYSEE